MENLDDKKRRERQNSAIITIIFMIIIIFFLTVYYSNTYVWIFFGIIVGFLVLLLISIYESRQRKENVFHHISQDLHIHDHKTYRHCPHCHRTIATDVNVCPYCEKQVYK